MDNSIINQEVMVYMNNKKGRKCHMVVRIDMAKAYDKVDWSTLLGILNCHGFGKNFCNMIQECISTISYSILINGSPCGFFKSTRGIRQGDHLSPALFTILSDILSRLLARVEALGKLTGVKISRCSLRISHLMYANDLVIYCQATPHEA